MVNHEDRGPVRLVSLDRPDRLNAFDPAMYDALADTIRSAADDGQVRVVVITGAGRAFSAGADVKALGDPSLVPLFAPSFGRMLDAFAGIDKPVIAAVNGLAVGVGTTLLLHCDLVLADAEARFRTPFPHLVTTPEAGSSLLLPRAVGPQFASWMLLTGEWVDAPTALQVGLIAKVCAPGTVVDEAMALAGRLAALAPEALAAAKRLMADGLRDLVTAARARETAAAMALADAGAAPRWR